MKLSKIIFDAERMKYPHTGLFHFCLNLGKAIKDISTNNVDLYYFLNKNVPRFFGDSENYINQNSFQKFIFPSFKNYTIWHSTFQLTAYMPKKKYVKIISTIHDLNFLKEGKSPQKTAKYLKKVQLNIDQSAIIVAISNYVKDDIEKYCKLNGKIVEVIYNGNNILPEAVKEVKAEYPIFTSSYIFTIGTVTAKKNFHVLPYLLQGNSLNLVISGIIQDESYKLKILAIADRLGVTDRVFITGSVSEKEKLNYLYNCSLFVFPSIAEGFGLPVVEAMALGKKVLLSKFTSLPEIGGEEAFYLEHMDEKYLSEFGQKRIMDLINSPDRTVEIKKWASQFSWEEAAKKYWLLYDKLSS